MRHHDRASSCPGSFGKGYRRVLFGRALLFLIAVAPAGADAQRVSGRLVTSFYTWEKFDTVGSSATYLRAFQAAQLSVAQGDFSLHTYMQGAVNVTSDFGDLGRVRAYNLYARWANIGKVADVQLGRQAVYSGVGNGTIDGVYAKGRLLKNKITIAGYWGGIVHPEFTSLTDNWSDNQMFGGQIVTTVLQNTRFGLSYVNRRESRQSYTALRSRDSSYIPEPYTIIFDSPTEQFVSGDASWSDRGRVSLYGRYDYDLLYERTSRGQIGGRLRVLDRLEVTADYIFRRPRIAYNSIFAAFVNNTVSEFEGGIEYEVFPRVRAFGRLANLTYTDETSLRWTVGLNSGYGSLAYSGSNGYAGELQSFSLQGSFPLMDNVLVPNAGVNFSLYRLNAGEDRQSALSFVGGVIVRPVQTITVDLQGQYMSNTIYRNDIRAQARFSYWFSESLQLF